MSRPLVFAVFTFAASISAASAAEVSSPQTQRREDPATLTTAAAPSKGAPNIVAWMGQAVEDILSGKVPKEARPLAGGK